MLFTDGQMAFSQLQKEFLGVLPSGFKRVKKLAFQKAKEIHFTPLFDVQPSVNTQGKLLLKCMRLRAASHHVKLFSENFISEKLMNWKH